MSATVPHRDRAAQINSVARPTAAKANLSRTDGASDEIHRAAQLIRRAVERTGLTHDQVQDALGIKDRGQVTRMIDGTHPDKLWVHCLLRRKAYPIFRELFIAVMLEAGDGEVERVVRIKERA